MKIEQSAAGKEGMWWTIHSWATVKWLSTRLRIKSILGIKNVLTVWRVKILNNIFITILDQDKNYFLCPKTWKSCVLSISKIPHVEILWEKIEINNCNKVKSNTYEIKRSLGGTVIHAEEMDEVKSKSLIVIQIPQL